MNFDRLNKWLTLGANVGVLIGIALLIIEVRQNQEILEMNQLLSIQDSMDREVDRYSELRAPRIQDKEVAQIYIDGLADRELDPANNLRFRDMCGQAIWAWTLMHDRSVVLGRQVNARGAVESLRQFIDQNPGMAKCWQAQRENLKNFWGYSDFVDAVDSK